MKKISNSNVKKQYIYKGTHFRIPCYIEYIENFIWYYNLYIMKQRYIIIISIIIVSMFIMMSYSNNTDNINNNPDYSTSYS